MRGGCHKCKYEISAECVPRSQKMGFPNCYRSIITNADRIRAMSDEEIEKWFWWMHKEMMFYTDSRHFLHDWLKQEAKEE